MQFRLYLHPISRSCACSRYGLSAFAGCLGINSFLFGSLHRYSAVIFIAAYAASGQSCLPIAVTSSSSNVRLSVMLVTWSERSTVLILTPTLLFRNTAIRSFLVFLSSYWLWCCWFYLPDFLQEGFVLFIPIGHCYPQLVKMDTDISQLSKSPDAALRILGALIALTL